MVNIREKCICIGSAACNKTSGHFTVGRKKTFGQISIAISVAEPPPLQFIFADIIFPPPKKRGITGRCWCNQPGLIIPLMDRLIAKGDVLTARNLREKDAWRICENVSVSKPSESTTNVFLVCFMAMSQLRRTIFFCRQECALVMGRAGKSRARAGPGRAEKNRFGPPGFRAKPEIL